MTQTKAQIYADNLLLIKYLSVICVDLRFSLRHLRAIISTRISTPQLSGVIRLYIC
ncbi:hypothetical protein M2133_001095 [Parabacteroides sp. PF5-6]|nr:hypothetical protein [Parabacteroides sp. PF5-6]